MPPGASESTFGVPQNQWLDYFQTKLATKSKAGPVDLVFDGDSITDHFESVGLRVWKQFYGQRHALDVAIGGDGVEHALWRLDHGEVDGLEPSLVVLLIGTNDIRAHPPQQVAEAIRTLVADYRQRLPSSHILLLAIFPRGPKATDPFRDRITQVNRSIASLDDGAHITYLDIGSIFLRPDGSIPPEIMPDFLHPNDKGYEMWANAIEPMIERYCRKLRRAHSHGFAGPAARAAAGGYLAVAGAASGNESTVVPGAECGLGHPLVFALPEQRGNGEGKLLRPGVRRRRCHRKLESRRP